MTRVLALAGSARRDSFNKRLLAVACRQVEEAGGEVTRVDLRDHPLPLYDGDLEDEHGLPDGALALKAAFAAHPGLLIACPEYNGSITPLLKNTIDWLSRKAGDEPPLAAFRGKVAGLIATSPGALGGLRGLRHVREILTGIGVLVIPDQVALPAAHAAFDAQGGLNDERMAGMLQQVARALVRTTGRLAEQGRG